MMIRKHTQRLWAVLLALCMAIPVLCVTLAACSPEEKEPPEATLESISLDTSAVKTEYFYGEAFTYEGLKVIAHLSDESTLDVPLSRCKITEPDMENIGQNTVEVTFNEKSASYTITVSERLLPPIGEQSLFTIAEGTTLYTVEMESLDYEISGVKAEEGKELIETAQGIVDGEETEVTYLANYGVENNYFGFTFTADKAYRDVMLVFRVANASVSETYGIGENMKVYLNYGGVKAPNDINVAGIPVVEPLGSYGDEDHADELHWQYRVLRHVSLKEGVNTLSFDVTGMYVLPIDRIDFCLDGMSEHVSRITLDDSHAETGDPFIQDFEDFDLQNITTRGDVVSNHSLKKGQIWMENCRKDAGGRNTSLAAIIKPTEFTTILHLEQDATIEPVMIGASIDTHIHYKNTCEFYVDGERLEDVEDKDIQQAGGYWNWKDTGLGFLDLEAGDHELRIVIIGEVGNIDAMKYYVHSYGGFASIESISVKTQPTKLVYSAGEVFDPAGMVLEAQLTNGNTMDLTSGYECTLNGQPAASVPFEGTETAITVTYKSWETTVNVTFRGEESDAILQGNGTFTVEAEDLDLSELVPRESLEECIQALDGASGGKNLGEFAKNSVLTVTIELKAAACVQVSALLSVNAKGTYRVVNQNTVTFAEQPIDVSTLELSGKTWQLLTFGEAVRLEAGVHRLVLSQIKDGHLNVDCFRFTVTEYGTEE